MKRAYPTLSALALVCLAFVASTSNIYAAKLYKWVDADGNISYQDQPPPADAKVLSEKTVPDVQAQSEPIAALTPISVYTVDKCDLCIILLARFEQWGIPAEEKPLQDDREAQAKILATSDSISAPAVFIGDKILTDIDEALLIQELEAAGYQPKQDGQSADDQ